MQDECENLEVSEFFSQQDRLIGPGCLVPRNQVNFRDGQKDPGQADDQQHRNEEAGEVKRSD
jgi:hypothetical protein